MNYIAKIKELSKLCLSDSDSKRIMGWLDQRDLLSIKEIITSEFIKFRRSKNNSTDELTCDETYANFAELESIVNEYLRLNYYLEDELNYYEEY